MAPANRRWRIVLRIVLPVFLCVFFLVDFMGLTWPLFRVTWDAMDWRSHYLAGIHSVDCGRVKVRGDASVATDCALQANAEGKPFRVIYNIQGYDSSVAGGVVRTLDGRLLFLSFDGFSFLRQRVSVTPCPKPYHLYVNPASRMNCFQEELSYPKNIGSPNFEPY
jgi:hypothetical protein